jgi:hypothetical protein
MLLKWHWLLNTPPPVRRLTDTLSPKGERGFRFENGTVIT